MVASVVMKAVKMSVSFERALGDRTLSAARRSGTGVSSWLAGAAAARLRADALREFLDDWEAEDGALTTDELRRAEAELGLRTGEPVAAEPGDRILTSDPDDIRRLATAAGTRAAVVTC